MPSANSIHASDLFFLRQCPVCESQRIKYAFQREDASIYECADCRLAFLNPQPSDEVLNRIYSETYFLGNDAEGARHRLALKSKTAAYYLEEILKLVPARGRLLEIGCGQGEFLVAARAAGFEVTGVEVSASAAQAANSALGEQRVLCGTLEDAVLADESFEVCVLLDVIEHVRNPLGLMERLQQLLKPHGLLFLVTPALNSWSARFFKKQWMEFKAEHLHYFDFNTIQNLLAKKDFGEVRICANHKSLSYRYIQEHFRKYPVRGIGPLLAGLGFFLPAGLKEHGFRLGGGSINVMARKQPGREKRTVSILVPVYNEVKTFPTLMAQLLQRPLAGLEKEIIIIESNSQDGTRTEVLKFAQAPNVKIILEEKPRGKGYAVRQGLKAATGDFIMIQDGDLEYDLNDYDNLLEPLRRFQQAFVLGSRHGSAWKMRSFETQPVIAFIMNAGQIFFTWLLNFFCGSRLLDPFTMFKVMRRDCLFRLRFTANRFDFDWELVMKLLRKGFYPLEIPVNYVSRSFGDGKKVRFFRDSLSWFVGVVQFRFGRLYTEDPKERAEA